MKVLKNSAARAYFVFAVCLLFPFFLCAEVSRADQTGAAKKTRDEMTEKTVPALIEEWFYGDRIVRKKAYNELEKREFTEQEFELVINALLEIPDTNSYHYVSYKFLNKNLSSNQHVLFELYKRAPAFQKLKLAEIIILCRACKDRERVEFFLEMYKTAPLAERKIIMKALVRLESLVYEDIQHLLLSNNETERRWAYKILGFKYNKLDYRGFLDRLFDRMVNSPGEEGMDALRYLKRGVAGYGNPVGSYEISYDFIKSKLDQPGTFEKTRIIHFLVTLNFSNQDLFSYMIDLAGGYSEGTPLERELATKWLEKRNYNLNDLVDKADRNAFFKKYGNSRSAAVRRVAFKVACRTLNNRMELLYHHIQNYPDYDALYRCLPWSHLSEEDARRFIPVIINSEVDYYGTFKEILNRKYREFALPYLTEAINSKDKTIRRNAFRVYYEWYKNRSDAPVFEKYILHEDLEIAAKAMSRRLELISRTPLSQEIKVLLIDWYQKRDSYNNKESLKVAIRGLATFSYFTAKELPGLVKLLSSPDYEIQHMVETALLELPDELKPGLVKFLSGGIFPDVKIFFCLADVDRALSAMYRLADERKFSFDYFRGILSQLQISKKGAGEIFSRLQTHPNDPIALFALSRYVQYAEDDFKKKNAEKLAQLWSSLYERYSKTDLSNSVNMLIFSLSAEYLYQDKEPSNVGYLAAKCYLSVLADEARLKEFEYTSPRFAYYNMKDYHGAAEKSNEPLNLFPLIVHSNEQVRERALKIIENSTHYPVRVILTGQNKKDLLSLQESKNPSIRGYATLLLFRFQKQIEQWNPQRHVANLADAIRHSYEGYPPGEGNPEDLTYPMAISYPRELWRAFGLYPQERFSLLDRCFSSGETYSQRLCLHLLKQFEDEIDDISPLIEKIILISNRRGEKDDKDLRRIAFEILCKRASENKKVVISYLKKILKPSAKFPEDLDELALKTEFLEQAIYLEKEGKELIPEMTRLYDAIERVSNLTSPPPGYARVPHPNWYTEHRKAPPKEYSDFLLNNSRRTEKLHQLYDLKLALTSAFLLYPENKVYTQKSIYFTWENTYPVLLPNYFWQAYRKHPAKLVRANE